MQKFIAARSSNEESEITEFINIDQISSASFSTPIHMNGPSPKLEILMRSGTSFRLLDCDAETAAEALRAFAESSVPGKPIF